MSSKELKILIAEVTKAVLGRMATLRKRAPNASVNQSQKRELHVSAWTLETCTYISMINPWNVGALCAPTFREIVQLM